MLDNISAAEKFVKARKSNEDFQRKEFKLGILTPLATNRFEKTDFSTPEVIDPRLKTLSAAGMTTSSDLQLINKELGVHHRQFLNTEMGAPKVKLLYTQNPDSRAMKTISRISQNLSKLNNYSKANWSHRDLNKKLLSAPSNISRNYDKSVNKQNNENLTVTHMKNDQRYEDVQSGSPVRREQRLSKLRKDYGFIDRNGTQFKTFSEIDHAATSRMGKTKQNKAQTAVSDSIKFQECNTARVINQDQKINYLLLKETKHKKTDVLGQKTGSPSQKLNLFTSPFKTSYTCNSQSNIIWSDHSKPKNADSRDVSANGRASTIDPLNPDRAVKAVRRIDFEKEGVFKKVNGVSEFNQITHLYNKNPNKDYLEALERKKHFRKAKGMCSEFAKLAHSQPR